MRRGRKCGILIERDGPLCVWCGKMAVGGASKDHVIPRGLGGPNHPDNYFLACRKCNNKRGMLTVEKFVRKAKNPQMDIIIEGLMRAEDHQEKVLRLVHDSGIR